MKKSKKNFMSFFRDKTIDLNISHLIHRDIRELLKNRSVLITMIFIYISSIVLTILGSIFLSKIIFSFIVSFLIPSFIMFIGTFGTMDLLEDIKSGMFQQISASPVRKWEIIFSKLTSLVTISSPPIIFIFLLSPIGGINYGFGSSILLIISSIISLICIALLSYLAILIFPRQKSAQLVIGMLFAYLMLSNPTSSIRILWSPNGSYTRQMSLTSIPALDIFVFLNPLTPISSLMIISIVGVHFKNIDPIELFAKYELDLSNPTKPTTKKITDGIQMNEWVSVIFLIVWTFVLISLSIHVLKKVTKSDIYQ